MAYPLSESFSSTSSFVDLFNDDPANSDADAGFQVFDPRGLFSPPSDSQTPLFPDLGVCRSKGRHEDESEGYDGGSRGALLPALQIPGTVSRSDVEKGFVHADSVERFSEEMIEGEGLMPGLARSASNDAMSPADSVPGTPASPPPLSRSLSGAKLYSPPRGRSALRRVLVDLRHAASLSPSPSGVPPRDSSAPFGASYIYSSPMGMSAAGSRPRRKSRQGDDGSPGEESIGSGAYSDMVASPAVSFLSSFADTTDHSRSGLRGSRDLDAESDAEEGDEVAGHRLGKVVGRGTFSVVREATEISTKSKVAVKIISHRDAPVVPPPSGAVFRDRAFSTPAPLSQQALSQQAGMAPTLSTTALATVPPPPPSVVADFLERELTVWSRLGRHPNILPMLDLYRGHSRTYIFMPFCEGGNLLQLINEHGGRGAASRQGRRRHTEPVRGMNDPTHAEISEDLGNDCESPPCGGLDLAHARHIFAQIVNGLEYLHCEAGVTHKDLKLENILLSQSDDSERGTLGTFRIADFGLANSRSGIDAAVGAWSALPTMTPTGLDSGKTRLPRIREMSDPLAASWAGPSSCPLRSEYDHYLTRYLTRPGAVSEGLPSFAQMMPGPPTTVQVNPTPQGYETAAGSLPYTPPEQLGCVEALLDPSVDIWALGCVLYALLEGRLPFTDDFEPRLRLKILKGKWEVPTVLRVKDTSESRAAEEVLLGCLEMDPNLRWTIHDVAASHWLAGCGVGDNSERRGRRLSRPPMRRLGSKGQHTVNFESDESRSRSKSRGHDGRADSKQRRFSTDLDSLTSAGPASPLMQEQGMGTSGGCGGFERVGRSRERRGRRVDRGNAGRSGSRPSGLSPPHSRSRSRMNRTFR